MAEGSTVAVWQTGCSKLFDLKEMNSIWAETRTVSHSDFADVAEI